MNFTLENIQNRVILAQCCLADMGIEILEAKAKGLSSRVDCLTRKAYMLDYVIGALRVFKPAIGTEVYTQSFTVSSSVATNFFYISYSGYQVTPTPTTIFETLTATETAVKVAQTINDYNSDNPEEVYATATSTDDVVYITIRLSDNVSDAGITLIASGMTLISNGDGEINDISAPLVSNDTAKKLLGFLDEYCGCQCGQSDAEIIDDTVPFSLEDEP